MGILVGTYSSVYIASPILIFFQNFVDARKKSDMKRKNVA
jgi:preprotein translocase subunit SecF